MAQNGPTKMSQSSKTVFPPRFVGFGLVFKKRIFTPFCWVNNQIVVKCSQCDKIRLFGRARFFEILRNIKKCFWFPKYNLRFREIQDSIATLSTRVDCPPVLFTLSCLLCSESSFVMLCWWSFILVRIATLKLQVSRGSPKRQLTYKAQRSVKLKNSWTPGTFP